MNRSPECDIWECTQVLDPQAPVRRDARVS